MGGLVRQTQAQELLSRLRTEFMNVGRLGVGLARDPRVPARNKMIFAGIAAYLFMPVELIPDWLPGIGKLDDLIMLCLAIDAMLNHVPQEVLDEYWEGDPALLEMVRSLVATATEFVPDQVVESLYPGELY